MRPLVSFSEYCNSQHSCKHSCHFHRFLITQYVLCGNSLVARCSIFACEMLDLCPHRSEYWDTSTYTENTKLSGLFSQAWAISAFVLPSAQIVFDRKAAWGWHIYYWWKKEQAWQWRVVPRPFFGVLTFPVSCLFKIQIFSPLNYWEARPMSLCRCKSSTWVINCEWTGTVFLLNELHPLVLFLLTPWCYRNQSKQQ